MIESASHNTPSFLSCDWGTSTFRLRIVRIDGIPCSDGVTDADGILPLYNRWKQLDQKIPKEHFFLDLLSNKIRRLEEREGLSLADIPVVISGMASSSIGLQELPYAPLPLRLDSPQLHTVRIEKSEKIANDIILLSGLKTDHDVMRGEETELLGLPVDDLPESATVIFPGTHSKHLTIRHRCLTGFKTWMTGELFELLSTKSILSNGLRIPRDPDLTGAFLDGLREAENNQLSHSLFKIRAGGLLKRVGDSDSALLLSGLLIGSELKSLSTLQPHRDRNTGSGSETGHETGSGYDKNHVILAANNELRLYYMEACRFFKLDTTVVDTGDLAAKGHLKLFNQIGKM